MEPPPARPAPDRGRELLKRISSVLLGPDSHDYLPLDQQRKREVPRSELSRAQLQELLHALQISKATLGEQDAFPGSGAGSGVAEEQVGRALAGLAQALLVHRLPVGGARDLWEQLQRLGLLLRGPRCLRADAWALACALLAAPGAAPIRDEALQLLAQAHAAPAEWRLRALLELLAGAHADAAPPAPGPLARSLAAVADALLATPAPAALAALLGAVAHLLAALPTSEPPPPDVPVLLPRLARAVCASQADAVLEAGLAVLELAVERGLSTWPAAAPASWAGWWAVHALAHVVNAEPLAQRACRLVRRLAAAAPYACLASLQTLLVLPLPAPPPSSLPAVVSGAAPRGLLVLQPGGDPVPLVRGALFFASMLAWGAARVEAPAGSRLQASLVLPFVLHAVRASSHAVVAVEAALSLRRLVRKHGASLTHEWGEVLALLHELHRFFFAAGSTGGGGEAAAAVREVVQQVSGQFERVLSSGRERVRLLLLLELYAGELQPEALLRLLELKAPLIHPSHAQWTFHLRAFISTFFAPAVAPRFPASVRMAALAELRSVLEVCRHVHEEALLHTLVPLLEPLPADPDARVALPALDLLQQVALLLEQDEPRFALVADFLLAATRAPLEPVRRAALAALVAVFEAQFSRPCPALTLAAFLLLVRSLTHPDAAMRLHAIAALGRLRAASSLQLQLVAGVCVTSPYLRALEGPARPPLPREVIAPSAGSSPHSWPSTPSSGGPSTGSSPVRAADLLDHGPQTVATLPIALLVTELASCVTADLHAPAVAQAALRALDGLVRNVHVLAGVDVARCLLPPLVTVASALLKELEAAAGRKRPAPPGADQVAEAALTLAGQLVAYKDRLAGPERAGLVLLLAAALSCGHPRSVVAALRALTLAALQLPKCVLRQLERIATVLVRLLADPNSELAVQCSAPALELLTALARALHRRRLRNSPGLSEEAARQLLRYATSQTGQLPPGASARVAYTRALAYQAAMRWFAAMPAGRGLRGALADQLMQTLQPAGGTDLQATATLDWLSTHLLEPPTPALPLDALDEDALLSPLFGRESVRQHWALGSALLSVRAGRAGWAEAVLRRPAGALAWLVHLRAAPQLLPDGPPPPQPLRGEPPLSLLDEPPLPLAPLPDLTAASPAAPTLLLSEPPAPLDDDWPAWPAPLPLSPSTSEPAFSFAPLPSYDLDDDQLPSPVVSADQLGPAKPLVDEPCLPPASPSTAVPVAAVLSPSSSATTIPPPASPAPTDQQPQPLSPRVLSSPPPLPAMSASSAHVTLGPATPSSLPVPNSTPRAPDDGSLSESSSSVSLASLADEPAGVHEAGMLPALLLLQMHALPGGGPAPVRLRGGEQLQRALKVLDATHPLATHKVGLLYAGEGQTADSVWQVRHGETSLRYRQLVAALGQLVRVRDHHRRGKYSGGLDYLADADGEMSVFWEDSSAQLMWHVCSLMPNVATDPQRLNKKRHIGNNYVNVLYHDSTDSDALPFDVFSLLPGSQLNAAVLVVQPRAHARCYRVELWRRRGTVGPAVSFPCGLADGPQLVHESALSDLVRASALHAELAAHAALQVAAAAAPAVAGGAHARPAAVHALPNFDERLRQIQLIKDRFSAASTLSLPDSLQDATSPPRV